HAAARPGEHALSYALQHARHVLLRGLRIAAAEQHVRILLHHVADRDQLVRRVYADQVAHQVVPGVAAGDGQTREHVASDAVQVAAERFADVFAKHVERGTAVEGDDHVLLAGRY